jgi:ribonuclease HI
MRYEIYTDGSVKGRWAAWAYLVVKDGVVVSEVSGKDQKTDNNRMEFQAAIEALKSVPRGESVTVWTDSRELLESIPLFEEWKNRGWRKKKNRAISNVDLCVVLHELLQTRRVHWKWVKAHSGNPYNERCDQLCAIVRSRY